MDEAAGMMPQGATTTLQSVPHCRALTHAKHSDRGNLSPPSLSDNKEVRKLSKKHPRVLRTHSGSRRHAPRLQGSQRNH